MSTTTRAEEFDSGLWTRARFEDLSASAALLYIWSWSNRHVGLAGLYEVGRRTMAREAKVPEAELDAALAELDAIGWAHYQDGVMWAPARVDRLKPQGRPMSIGVVRALDAIDAAHPLRARWLARYGHAGWLQEALFDDDRRAAHLVDADRRAIFTRRSGDGHETVTRPSESPDSIGNSETLPRPSPDGHPTVFKQEQEQEQRKDQQRGAHATAAGPIDHHALPVDFPEALAARAEQVLVGVRAIQQRVSPRSAPATLYRIGIALRESPDVDHMALVRGKFDGWANEPKRLQRRNGHDLDVVAAFIEFCQRAQRDVTGRPAAGVGAGPRRASTAQDLVAAMEARRAVAGG